jgi:hypothetical protein
MSDETTEMSPENSSDLKTPQPNYDTSLDKSDA